MPMVRAMRLMNSIEAGSTSGVQLQAQLINGGVQSDYNSIMQLPGQCSVLAASLTAISAINLSPIAIGLTANNPIPNLAMSRNTIARNYIFASARSLLNSLVIAAPQNWYPYASWTQSLGVGLNRLSYASPNSAGRFIAFGNGVYVATSGSASRDVKTSTDGITWTVNTNALPVQADGFWMGVTFGNGVFVAVSGGNATSNTAAYSTDGVNWTATTLPNLAQWTNIACGLVAGTFTWIAISGGTSSSSTMAKSTNNGVTWAARTGLISSQLWASIGFGNSTFVMVPGGFPWLSSGNFNTGYRSTDGGDTWTSFSLHVGANWMGIANSQAVGSPTWWTAINSSGQNTSYSSNNGATFADSSGGAGSNFIVSPAAGTLLTNSFYSTNNGASWTSINGTYNYDFTSSYSAVMANGVAIAVSASSPYIAKYSQTTVNANGFFYAFRYDFRVTSSLFANNLYYAFGYGGYYTSPDQQTWTWNPVPAFATLGGPVSVAYDGTSTFVAVFGGANGAGTSIDRSAYSTNNGVTWQFGNTMANKTTAWTSVAYGNGRFVAVSGWPNRQIYAGNTANNNEGVYSSNGISWTASNLTGSQDWSQVIFANGYFVACSPSSTQVYYSTNGTGWTTGFSCSSNPRQIAFGTIGGQPYWVATSSDGTNGYLNISVGSTAPTTAPNTYVIGSDSATVGTIYAISFANGYFFATTNTNSTNWVYSSNAPTSSSSSWIRTTLPATTQGISSILTSPGPISLLTYPTAGSGTTPLGVANL